MQPRPELLDLPPAVHGSAPLSAGAVLDFSVSSNPLGPASSVLAAARAAPIGRYPEPDAATLRTALAAGLNVAPERLVVGNGSAELIWLLALAYIERGQRALVVGPTFAEYARAARLMGARVAEYRASAADGFRLDVAALCRVITATRPRLTFLCNPNNPTGVYLGRADVERLLAVVPGLLVLDEAYAGFVPEPWDVRPLLTDGRLVVLRSLTKDHALAGLRLGYALAAPAVARALQWAQPPWSVNAVAQAAGLAALAAGDHVTRGRALAREATAYLAKGLRALGLEALPSAANFFLVAVPDGSEVASALRAAGIYVRDCASFGLPGYLRLAARPLAECDALLAALERVLTTNVLTGGARR
ncbi:MAG TPA: histidinol-phosphate transaminase [Chloroflexota bacterium]|nr:histidinol-phosphate transaminase [Chloroflexota bacterium]